MNAEKKGGGEALQLDGASLSRCFSLNSADINNGNDV